MKKSAHERPRIKQFASRDDYVAWTALWKRTYAGLSDEIRTKKRQCAMMQRERPTTGAAYQHDLVQVRRMAFEMMLDRGEAKAVARASMEARMNKAA